MESLSKGSRGGFAELWRRQVGLSQPRSVERLIGGSEVLVKRIDLYGKLDGHEGCVNAVEFNSTGDFLVSGSDDTEVILWNWATRTKKLSYPSGHIDNIFQTRIMPFTDDRKIVTSAGDGQIRLGQILEDGWVDTKRLGKHQGRVYKLAIEPGSPHIFYSCGEDGFIQHFDLRSHSATKLFWNYQWDASSNSDRPVNTFCPHHLIGYNGVHITGLAYSKKSELLVSYNDELVYLFQKNMGIGPDPPSVPAESLQKQEQPQVYIGHRNSQTVKGVSFFGPSDEYVLSGSDCGHIFIWKKKGGQLLRLMVGDRQVVNQLEPHPHFPVFATSGMEKNIKLWAPLANDPIPLPDNAEEIMEANRQGREDRSRITLNPDVIMHVLRLQRRQTLAYIERRYTRADQDSDGEDEGEAYIFGLSDGDSSEEGLNNRECNIS
ncbi:PREDICTED: DDB1- and CUL4-associated factor 8-like isoform X2 [Nelumbo nucifera]|uniref:DDB1- and CUL4-associated factor 8-like n=2 Tax=Nelumbo nucifera TaxID=4432 RepID=A0A822Y4B4_NELNU|nr:PREDICTED: DDB1- and CUL4-associated factor 8-like isoform X2 [Nelumbo nucifera]DAD26066.1 TPA_asm: hypothetical protein HUJ06_027534 [Nelumbo nucifera]